jgi:hypothetical protein
MDSDHGVYSFIMCRAKRKLMQLTVLLQSDFKNADILCFAGQWLKEEQIVSSARIRETTYYEKG